jgi:protein TonB
MVADDSLVTRIVGNYRSDADPNGHVLIGSLGRGVLSVIWGSAWDAIGYWDGHEFRGVARAPYFGAAPPPEGRTYGELVFRAASADTLRASLDLGGRTAAETWVRVRPLGRAPRDARDDGFPAPDDDVYVEELPEVLTRAAPVYPEAARKARIEGTVVVRGLVDRDGRVRDVRVTKSIPGLDQAAEDCVRQWTFKPAMAKGSPVAVWVAIPVKFTLR